MNILSDSLNQMLISLSYLNSFIRKSLCQLTRCTILLHELIIVVFTKNISSHFFIAIVDQFHICERLLVELNISYQ